MLIRRFLSLTSTNTPPPNERIRRASGIVIDYDLSIESHLDRCFNKRKLPSGLGIFNRGVITTVNSVDDSKFRHDETNVITVLDAA